MAYTKPGLIGVFNAVRGSCRELRSTPGGRAGLLAAGPGGLGPGADAARATILSSKPATEVALGGTVAYWLDRPAPPLGRGAELRGPNRYASPTPAPPPQTPATPTPPPAA